MKLKQWMVLTVMAAAVFGLSIYALCKPADDYSMSERRTLAQFPEVSAQRLLDGRFMSDFETYSQDQFPFRETMRRIKAVTSRYALGLMDNHGLYVLDGYASKLEYPLSEPMLNHAGQVLNTVYEACLKDTDCQLYWSVVPDKNAFLAPRGGYPAMDYDRLVETMGQKLDFAQYLDIFDLLELEDYYRTDQHWRQERIVDVAQRLAEGMGAEFDPNFTEHTLSNSFYGTYVGQTARNLEPDELHYLTNAALDSVTATSFGTGYPADIPVYNMEKAVGKDPYEMFLNGADPLVVLENPNAATDKELVIFRDSFGSSLAPLLASGYAKITLVDLRYLHSQLLSQFVTFDHQDVLFCYSTLILNNSLAIK